MASLDWNYAGYSPFSQDNVESLFFSCQNNLLALGTMRHAAFLAVFANVIFPPLDCCKLLFLDFTSLLDSLWHMAMVLDPSNLGHVRVSTDKGLIVFKLVALLSTLHSST